MIVVMLNQRWKFKKCKVQKPREIFVYQEKAGRLIGESSFVVLNYVIWLIRNSV